MRILKNCVEDNWIMVSFLLLVNYVILFVTIWNVHPVDFSAGGFDYVSVLGTYEVYFVMAVCNGFIILIYQYQIKSIDLIMKVILYTTVTVHVFYELYFLIALLPTMYAFFSLQNTEATGTWIADFQQMKHLANGLRFRPVEYIDNSTNNKGITEPASYLQKLIQLKPGVDEIQRIFRCCGLEDPSDWVTDFSGSLTKAQTTLGSTYVWWTSEADNSSHPDSCCVTNYGPVCVPAKNGCLFAVVEAVQINVLGFGIFIIILGVVSISRDVVLIRIMYNSRLKSLPTITEGTQNESAGEKKPRSAALSPILPIYNRVKFSSESSA